ncbi:solute carrier family 25 [Capsaspora owczarzaki ATCC 30864]|nr:solute carrier family 25 [Capsaspora owczarzaki ATCC 30864]|eukprot:XP_004343393.1 solute carrier family 25 [Capsaspora owczarzaki ATCC 30864]
MTPVTLAQTRRTRAIRLAAAAVAATTAAGLAFTTTSTKVAYPTTPRLSTALPQPQITLQTKSVPATRAAPKPAQHLLGGTVGGIMGIVASYPFDTVKVRIQTQPPGSALYTGMVDCFRKIIKSEGALALYSGMLSPVVGVAGVKAVVFGSYGGISQWLLARKQGVVAGSEQPQQQQQPVKLSGFENALASCSAGLVATIVVTPVERVKVSMQASGGKAFKSTLDCVLSLVRTAGISGGLFKGFVPTVLREVPSYGAYFISYDMAKRAFCQPGQDVSTLSPGLLALAGGIAGVMAWVPIYPIDVIKSRIQAQPSSALVAASSGSSSRPYSGVVDCAVRSYRAEGLGVFFRGLTPTIARAFPCHAAVFLGYELTLRYTAPLFA